jgi:hypothetical protein
MVGITLATALAALNVVLLAPLVVVWARNYSTFRTTLVAGLLVVAVAMLVENALAIYYFFSMQSFYAMDPGVTQAVVVLRAIQFVAVAVLSYATLK